jgi:hypothetical protein
MMICYMIFGLFLSGANESPIFGVGHALRTIYGQRPFQRVQICEDRLLGTGDMSGQGDCLKVKNIHL